jgi:arylsulfatase A-like enzyme
MSNRSLFPQSLLSAAFGFAWGSAEAIYILKHLPYRVSFGETAGLLVFAAVLYALLFGVIGWLTAWVPFLRFKRRGYRTAAIIVGVTVLIGSLLSIQRQPTAPVTEKGGSLPNLLLITLDTTSAEHLSLYGYERLTSPKLDSLAQKGIVFEQAITVSPWTLASHATMFTGLYPSEHQATYRSLYLKDNNLTLAEILADRGYRTAGFVGGPFVGRSFGLAQGFSYYDDQLGSLKLDLLLVRALGNIWESVCQPEDVNALKHWISRWEGYPIYGKRPADKINSRVLDYVSGWKETAPYFIFINYFDPHQPYQAPASYDTLFADSFCPSPSDSLMELNRRFRPLRHRYFAGSGSEKVEEFEPIADLYRRLGRNCYDALIRYTDDELNRLLEEFSARGLLDNTYIVITADHGEAVGTHRLWGHDGLYEEIVKVPLIILGPDLPAGVRVSEQVSLKDLFGTVLKILKVDDPAPVGDLCNFWKNSEDTLSSQAAFAQFFRSEHLIQVHGGWFDRDALMLRTPQWKIIRRTNGTVEKYDLTADPDERFNLADSLSTSELDEELSGFMEKSLEFVSQLKQRKLRSKDRDKLRAVGYLQ